MKTLNRSTLRSKLTATTVLLLCVVALTGCFSRKDKKAAAKPDSTFKVKSGEANPAPILTPITTPVGRVVSVNNQAKFAVVSFPVGQLPANETRMTLFRAGAKAGEIKITGPAQESFTVGDITSGTAQEGDEVRAE